MMIYRVLQALKNEKVEFAIAGGWAVSLHGAVRGTVDLDLVIVLNLLNLEKTERALLSVGLESRLPISAKEVFSFRREFIERKNMFAWRFVNPTNPTEIVDILINEDLSKLKRKEIQLGSQKVALVSVDDLIKMKRKAGRPQDLEDVKALELLKK